MKTETFPSGEFVSGAPFRRVRLRPAQVRLMSFALSCPACGERLALASGQAVWGEVDGGSPWALAKRPPKEITCASCRQRCEVPMAIIAKMFDRGISPKRRRAKGRA